MYVWPIERRKRTQKQQHKQYRSLSKGCLRSCQVHSVNASPNWVEFLHLHTVLLQWLLFSYTKVKYEIINMCIRIGFDIIAEVYHDWFWDETFVLD